MATTASEPWEILVNMPEWKEGKLDEILATAKISQNYATSSLRKDPLGDDFYRSVSHQDFPNLQIGKFAIATAELS